MLTLAKETSSRYVKESTLKEILKAHSSDLKKHFAALLGPVNKELALLREELQSRDIAIAELKKEVSAVKATNDDLLNTNKGLEAKLSEFDEFRKATLESEEKVEDRTNRQLSRGGSRMVVVVVNHHSNLRI